MVKLHVYTIVLLKELLVLSIMKMYNVAKMGVHC